MGMANSATYLNDLVEQLKKQWPNNRTINLVFHGHSVPAGYFATPRVDTLHSYPHLLHRMMNERFPFAVVNVIVTAIGGEDADKGAERFERDVLGHRPDVIAIDYGLNDRRIGRVKAEQAWKTMIEQALHANIKVLLLTPTWDTSGLRDQTSEEWTQLRAHTDQIRRLAAEYSVGLVDSFAAFERYDQEMEATDLLSWSNHPNEKGHALVANQLLRWFAYR